MFSFMHLSFQSFYKGVVVIEFTDPFIEYRKFAMANHTIDSSRFTRFTRSTRFTRLTRFTNKNLHNVNVMSHDSFDIR